MVEAIAAAAAAVVVVAPALVAVINALRNNGRKLDQVTELVNGHSSRMDARLEQLQAELEVERRRTGRAR